MSERVVLPNGFWSNEAHCREAKLRPLNGDDEEFLAESSVTMLPVARSTNLLARCLISLEPGGLVTPEMVGHLTVGDREALLLHLRRLSFGDRLHAVLNCPHPDCGELMDLDLYASDLLRLPGRNPEPEYEHTVEHDGKTLRVLFRLPTVSDQEMASLKARTDIDGAADLILRRCVKSVVDENGASVDWTAEMLDSLPVRMAELDPQAEMILDLTCPACGLSFSTFFDAGDYLFQEAGNDLNRLYHEVHLLALHYHWSESEIMGMGTLKRRRYLNLLLESLPQV